MIESEDQPEPQAESGEARDSEEDTAPASGGGATAAVLGEGASTPDEVRGWAGSRLDEIGGASVARVEGAYFDAESGEPEWLMVRMGRFGHHSLVPARNAVSGVGHVWVPYERDLIRKAPRVEPGQELTKEQELGFCEHFVLGEGTGRKAELSGRADGAVTARPA